jgi:hypothetical protein
MSWVEEGGLKYLHLATLAHSCGRGCLCTSRDVFVHNNLLFVRRHYRTKRRHSFYVPLLRSLQGTGNNAHCSTRCRWSGCTRSAIL